MSIKININFTQMVNNSLGGDVHKTLAAEMVSPYDPEDPGTPFPSLANKPFIGIIAAPVGEVGSLAQIIVGLAGMTLFAIPAICHSSSRQYLKISATTLAVGSIMAVAYPIMLVTGHAIFLYQIITFPLAQKTIFVAEKRNPSDSRKVLDKEQARPTPSAFPSKMSPLSSQALPPYPIRHLVFSGGGAKGIIYFGILETFLREDEFFRENLVHVTGSSVGAITAAYTATGIGLQELAAASILDFNTVLDPEKKIGKKGNALTEMIRLQLQTNIQNRLHEIGEERIHERCKHLLSWEHSVFQELQTDFKETDPAKMKITFQMLQVLRKISPEHFKELSITGTLENSDGTYAEKSFIFNAETCPQLDIALACRASASLPIVFEKTKIPKAKFPGADRYLPPGTEELKFIDGGWFSNVPMNIIETSRLQGLSGEDRQHHLQQTRLMTVAFVFETRKNEASQVSVFDRDNPAIPGQLGVKGWVADHVVRGLIVPRTMGKHSKHRQAELGNLKNTLTLGTNLVSLQTDLKTTDFTRASVEANQFIELGRQQARECLANRVVLTQQQREKLENRNI
ncbi:MAG: patatin-like phospholipase family protein [Chlamydiales bacterium]|nr:patatin-like phospholipase family protein [Chlamydiales bacterium]